VDAVKEPFDKNYKMFSYITSELPAIIGKNFPVLPERFGIFGHRYLHFIYPVPNLASFSIRVDATHCQNHKLMKIGLNNVVKHTRMWEFVTSRALLAISAGHVI